MDIERIKKLNELRDSGMITDEEFERERAKAANAEGTTPEPAGGAIGNEHSYAVLLHLSQFLGWVIPFLGLIVPVVMWQGRKEDPIIDAHGRNVTNWILSLLIYTLIAWLLIFVMVGFILFPILAIWNIIVVIMGAIKAGNGEVWHYPGAIRFFK